MDEDTKIMQDFLVFIIVAIVIIGFVILAMQSNDLTFAEKKLTICTKYESLDYLQTCLGNKLISYPLDN